MSKRKKPGPMVPLQAYDRLEWEGQRTYVRELFHGTEALDQAPPMFGYIPDRDWIPSGPTRVEVYGPGGYSIPQVHGLGRENRVSSAMIAMRLTRMLVVWW